MPRDNRRRSRSESRTRRRNSPDKRSRRDTDDGRRAQRDDVPKPASKSSKGSKFEDFDVNAHLTTNDNTNSNNIPSDQTLAPPALQTAAAPSAPFFGAPSLSIGGVKLPGLDENANAFFAPPPPPVDPSVEQFVPMIPKSLLPLVNLPLTVGGAGSALAIALQPPAVSTEFTKLARECRRCHITGFPNCTTKDDLKKFFADERGDATKPGRCDQIRRQMIMKQTERKPAPNAILDVDRIVDIFLDVTKNNPFAFVELNMEDMAAELIERSGDDNFDPFLAADGNHYPLKIRRPKDFRLLNGCDWTKLVILNIPSVLAEKDLKRLLSSYGTWTTFQQIDRMAYVEFDAKESVVNCVEEVNGSVIAGRMLVLRPLSDCLKAVCASAGFKVTPNAAADGADPFGAPGGPTERDLCKETMEMICTLPKILTGLEVMYPHLNPLFGASVPVFPTPVLVLMNMIDEEHDLTHDEDYSLLLQAISDEVEQYGRVKRLIVPRRAPMPAPPKPFVPGKQREAAARDVNLLKFQNPFDTANNTEEAAKAGDDEDDDDKEHALRYEQEKEDYQRQRDEWYATIEHPIFGSFGRAFVEYENADEAAYAQRGICGKLFGGRTVVTSFMFLDVLYPPEPAAAEGTIAENNLGEGLTGEPAERVEGEDVASGKDGDVMGPVSTENID